MHVMFKELAHMMFLSLFFHRVSNMSAHVLRVEEKRYNVRLSEVNKTGTRILVSIYRMTLYKGTRQRYFFFIIKKIDML